MKCPRCQSDNTDTARFCSNCAAPLTSSQELIASKTMTIQQHPKFISKGSILAGKYRIIEPIGKGGMGVVYKAEDITLERTVALKFLPAELTEDPEARERFVREAKAAAALSHPHICTIHEIGEEENQYFIAMECIEGQSLKQKILKGPLDQAEALDIAIQVAEGLQEAHRKEIIHRDIKPGNIMVTDKGTAKVMDFGLAKVFGASLITKEAKTMGTVAYMSPEQAQGQSADHRTDIWSLGVVLYEMLTGELPFKGEYDQSIIHSILNREPEALTKLRPNLPRDLEKVVLTALAKNPTGRYQSMEEFLEDLKAIAEGLKPLRAKAKPLKGISNVRKRRWLWGAAVVSMVAVLATVSLVIVGGRKATGIDSIAVLPLKNLSGDPEQEYFADGVTEALITNLAKVKSLKVISTTSVMQYKGLKKSLPDIASELKVDAVVEGSVQQVGNRVRVTAQLIHASTDQHMWADTFEKDVSDILTLQSDLALAIAREVQVQAAEQQRLKGGTRSINPEAYKAYLKGLHAFQIGGLPNESIRHIERAIELDPGYAPAYAFLACLYNWQTEMTPGESLELLRKAKTAALKAIELDPDIGQAHSALGLALAIAEWDWAGAEREIRLGVRLSPNSVQVHDDYRIYLWSMGRFDEALDEINKILELDPLSQLYRGYPSGHYY